MPTKRIIKIEIQNFRAFYAPPSQPHIIELGDTGKNLLVYGENGSGKSSLFLALKTFFDSSTNPVPFNEFRFIPTGESGNGHVSLHFTPIGGTPYQYHQNSSITNTNQIFIREVNEVQGFLTYRQLQQVFNINTRNPNLFELLLGRNGILLNSINPATSRTFHQDFELLKNHLTLRTTDSNFVRHFERNSNYSTIGKINIGLAQKLEEVRVLVNELMATFGYKVQIHRFQNQRLDYFGRGTSKSISGKNIQIEAHLYSQRIADYNVFFNEARLSALAICIYFASILTMPPHRQVKLLVLDDIVIGLDMGNRMPILKILEQKFSDYQIIMTTYDKQWYELVKKYFAHKQTDKWTHLEMYVDEDSYPNFNVPHLIPTTNNLLKGKDYLVKHDYPACGNYLRKCLEENLYRILPDNLKSIPRMNPTTGQIESKLILDLETLLGKFKSYCQSENINFAPFEDWKIYKDTLLNPLSHHNFLNPVYKAELLTMIRLLEKIEALRNNIIIEAGEEFRFKLTKANGNFWSFKLKLKEHLRLILEPNATNSRLGVCRCEVFEADDNGSLQTSVPWHRMLGVFFENMYKRFHNVDSMPATINIFDELILSNGNTLASLRKY